jgi:hypothetical protein
VKSASRYDVTTSSMLIRRVEQKREICSLVTLLTTLSPSLSIPLHPLGADPHQREASILREEQQGVPGATNGARGEDAVSEGRSVVLQAAERRYEG